MNSHLLSHFVHLWRRKTASMFLLESQIEWWNGSIFKYLQWFRTLSLHQFRSFWVTDKSQSHYVWFLMQPACRGKKRILLKWKGGEMLLCHFKSDAPEWSSVFTLLERTLLRIFQVSLSFRLKSAELELCFIFVLSKVTLEKKQVKVKLDHHAIRSKRKCQKKSQMKVRGLIFKAYDSREPLQEERREGILQLYNESCWNKRGRGVKSDVGSL